MRVLIVEDDPSDLDTLHTAVADRLGHTCLVARDGQEAWRLFHEAAPDAVVSAWQAPGLDGVELCRRIRAVGAGYTYVVLASASGGPERRLETLRAGADDHLAKPFRPDELEACLLAAERLASAHRRMADSEREARALYEAALALGDATDLEARLGRVLEATARLIGIDQVEVALADPSAREVTVVAARGISPRSIGLRMPIGDGLNGWVLANGRPLRVGDMWRHPQTWSRRVAREEGNRSWLGVPLLDGDEAFGVLAALSAERDAFADEHERRLAAFAALAGAAIREARLLQRYRTLVERLPVAAYVAAADATGTPRYVSPPVEALLGYPPQAWLNGSGHGLSIVHADDRERLLAAWQRLRAGEDALLACEYRVTARDGREVWVLDEAVMVRDEAGGGRYAQGVITDVTGRKRAEEALRESEARFRSLFTSTPDAILVVDATGRYLDANPAAAELLGYTRDELLHIRVTDVTAAGPDFARAAFGRLLQDGVWSGELELRRKDGSPIAAELRATTVPLATETVYLGIVRDISARKQAEREREQLLQQERAARRRAEAAEQEARALYAAALAVGAEADLPTRLERVLDAALALVGAKAAEVMLVDEATGEVEVTAARGRPAPPVGLRQPPGTGAVGAVLAGNRPLRCSDLNSDPRTWNVEQARRLGVRGWLGVPLADGGSIFGVLTVLSDQADAFTDEDERRLAALAALAGAAIREARLLQRYRTLVEQLPVAAYVSALDAEGSSLYVSPQVEALLGYLPQEWRADPRLWSALVHPDDRDRVFATWKRTIEHGTPFACEYRAISRDGRTIWLWEQAVLVRDEATGAHRAHGVCSDITEYKRAEEALRQAEQMYRSLVEQLPAITYRCMPDAPYLDTYVSPQVQTLLGFTPAEWLTVPNTWAQQLHPEDREQALAWVADTLQRDERYANEYRLVDKEGRVHWVDDAAVLVRDPAGLPLYFQGVMLDVTERKHLQEQAEHLAALEERERLAMDLHDGVIQSLYAVSLTIEAHARTAHAHHDGANATLAEELAQLDRTIQEVRAYIRGLRLQAGDADPSAAIVALAEELRASAALRVDLALSPVTLGQLTPAAAAHLTHLTREVLSNVRRHARARAVSIRLESDQVGLALTIRDDGRGFDPTRTGRRSGDGLRNMAERTRRLGGSLAIRSAPGRGTEIRVLLPPGGGAASTAPRSAPESAPGQPGHQPDRIARSQNL